MTAATITPPHFRYTCAHCHKCFGTHERAAYPALTPWTWNCETCERTTILRAYNWLYIPTGHRGRSQARFDNPLDYASKLLDWNRQGAGTWQYWEDFS